VLLIFPRLLQMLVIDFKKLGHSDSLPDTDSDDVITSDMAGSDTLSYYIDL